ncbi:MAG: DNA translocase FtsK, partial [Bacteroidales bacterium]|nr:DNA translocase FtsK [Bacteroidales bacterium]
EYNAMYSAHKLNPKNGHRFLPYIVGIIDEYSQLVLGMGGPEGKAHAKSIMTCIVSLAQMGRACGIHLVIATQTPRKDVVSGLIKANFPMSIAFKTKTYQDSMVILDQTGAEDLLGDGDMLLSYNAALTRIQCGYISSSEIDTLNKAIEEQKGYKKSFNTPYYLLEVKEDGEGGSGDGVDMSSLDSKFEEAARMVVISQRGSTSDLQRRLGMGYAKAGRVMDQLEAAGIVGPQNGSKPREVLIQSINELEPILKAYVKT